MNGPREHDQAVERLLRQSLDTPPRGGVTDACLDAETLAAWTAGSLSGAALEDVQLHVADCPRCQEIAGTLARLSSVAPHPEPAVSSRRWLAWFVPLATATAALAIWLAVPGNVAQPPTSRELDRFEQAPPSPPAEAPVSRDRATPEQKVERREAAAPPPGEPAAPVPAEPSVSEAERSSAASQLKQEPAPAAASPDSKEAAASSDLAKNRVEAARAPAAVPTPAPAAAPTAVAASRAAVAAVASDVIMSPDPAVRWRIIGSAVQHTSNGGSTWEAVSTGFPAELTSGAAPAATVCWLVGRNGVVLLTMDGQTWRRVAFPEAVDLSAVRTVDAGGRVATVSTTDGRTFVTTDAGATWALR